MTDENANLQERHGSNVPDADDPGCGEADDVLIGLVDDEVDDGEEVPYQLPDWSCEDVRVPDANGSVNAPRRYQVCLDAEIECIHTLWQRKSFNLP